MNKRYVLFDEILKLISKQGVLKLVFTPRNVAFGDSFLIFSGRKEQKVKICWIGDLVWVVFDGDDPMLLEDCPTSFLESIVKAAKEQSQVC